MGTEMRERSWIHFQGQELPPYARHTWGFAERGLRSIRFLCGSVPSSVGRFHPPPSRRPEVSVLLLPLHHRPPPSRLFIRPQSTISRGRGRIARFAFFAH